MSRVTVQETTASTFGVNGNPAKNARAEVLVSSPLEEGTAEIAVHPLSDGRVEIFTRRSTRKTLGKGRYHTESVCLTVSAEQWAMLSAVGKL